MKNFNIIILLLNILFLTSCKKQNDTLKIPMTTFFGNFHAEGIDNILTKNVNLTLNNDNTFSFSNPNVETLSVEKYPYYIVNGAGKYSVMNNMITFQDTLLRTLPAQYPHFLHGKYNYHFDGKILVIDQYDSYNKILYKFELYTLENF